MFFLSHPRIHFHIPHPRIHLHLPHPRAHLLSPTFRPPLSEFEPFPLAITPFKMLLLPSILLLSAAALATPSVLNYEGLACLEYASNTDGSPGPCKIWSDAASGKSTATGSPCKGGVNGPKSRSCWKNGFNISTDFDVNWPETGVTRKYDFEITNGTAAPDGTPRITFLINGQYMGPTIFADWGDYVEVTVTNKLQNNGTGIHWHGLRQLNNNWEDGVPGLTECPLAPGQTKTYRWQATQYGTSW